MSKETKPKTQPETQDDAPNPEATNEAVAAEASTPVEAEPSPAALEETPEAALEAARKEAAEHRDRHLRAVADMENLRRRLAREREDIRRTAAASVIEDLLPALDNLQIGLDAAANHPEAKAVTQGFEFVAQQFRQVLSDHGLEKVEPAGGAEFDPNEQEAIGHEAHDDLADGAVIRVQRPGYKLNGRLLRAAAVVVSSGKAQES